MNRDRPASVLPGYTTKINLDPTRAGAAGSRFIEFHTEEISEGGHHLMSENLPLGDFEDPSKCVKPHIYFHPLGHGGGDEWTDVDLGLQVRKNIRERIAPTIICAKEEKDKYAIRAMRTRYTLNAVIALQVLTGVLTTVISVAISGKRMSFAISALGGLTTLMASYLALVNSRGEPEIYNARIKDLAHFLRDCESFTLLHGEEYGTSGDGLDEQIENLRRRFELLLANKDA